jgi:hypothetical protein
MKRVSIPISALLFALCFAIVLNGCGYNNGVTNIQRIAELVWKNDGSGLYGFAQKTSISDASGLTASEEYTPAVFDGNGSLVKQFTEAQKAVTDYSYSLFVSPDGTNAITQLGNDLYRIDLNTGAATKLDSLFHLLVASPDLHYAVGTFSPDNRLVKTVTILDLSTPSPTTVHEFDISEIKKTPGIWCSGSTFGLSFFDSAGSHITIFDIDGSVVRTIGGAEAPFHNGKYIASTNTLYFRERTGSVGDGLIDKMNLTTGSRQVVLNISSIENFDITSDEQFMVYNTYVLNTDSVTSTLKLKIRNLSTGQEKELTSDILGYCILSPAGDKVAYVRGNVTFNEAKVITATRP